MNIEHKTPETPETWEQMRKRIKENGPTPEDIQLLRQQAAKQTEIALQAARTHTVLKSTISEVLNGHKEPSN